MTNFAPEASVPPEQSRTPLDVARISVPTDNVIPIMAVGGVAIPEPNTVEAPGAPQGGEEGKGEDSAPFTPSTLSNAAFIAALFGDLPAGARPAICSKPGDPEQGSWIAIDAATVDEVCPPDRNNYCNCASFFLSEDGTLAARKEQVAAYHLLMLDDVGTKIPRIRLGDIEPSWSLETSPGNYQIGFRLSAPITDPVVVDRLQKRIKAAGLTDIGAQGINRWARLPRAINGKAKYAVDGKPFFCCLHQWNPTVAYSAEELLQALAPNSSDEKNPGAPTQGGRSSTPAGNGVYFPRSVENPVVTAFKQRGLYKRMLSPGRHDVTCPWVDEHTDGLDSGAAYFEPSEEYAIGGFVCQHSHKDDYHVQEVLEKFGLTEEQARDRTLIRVVPGQMNRVASAAEKVLTLRGGLYQSAGFIAAINDDPVTKEAVITPLSDATLARVLSDACDWEKYDGRRGVWVATDPPERHVRMLLKAQNYEFLPVLRGLARQPHYRPDGSGLVSQPGYDLATQRVAIFDPEKFAIPEPTEVAAREALQLIRENLLSEFHFAKDIDEAAAVAAIFTAVTRPSLDLAPAFHVAAPSSGTGKSYLCETIAKFAGAGSPARVSYPRNSDEATKAVLSLLLSAPLGILFDDMDTDWIAWGPINRMLTSPYITERVLGFSKTATVSTAILVLGSGNNVAPVRDLARRVITINLDAKTASPATLAYKGNPVGELSNSRERYVSAVLTVIEAWRAAGSPKPLASPIASYGGDWSDYCRHPLIWLGLPDPATILVEQVLNDSDSEQLVLMLEEWFKAFGDKPVTVRRMLDHGYDTPLHDALMELPVVERGTVNRSKLGWLMKRNQNRIIHGYMIQKAPNAERNAWRVVQVQTPPSPPLPPLAQQNVADADSAGLQRAPEDEF